MAAFIISLAALEHNARILRDVALAADCKMVLALKGFSCWQCFDTIRPYADGCCASGLWEAQLAHNRFGKAVLTYSPAFAPGDILPLADISTHIDFNSLSQWRQFSPVLQHHPRFAAGQLHCGLRINPLHSTGHVALYDPCAPGSRLGMTAHDLLHADLTGISGLHFHTLCEQGANDLASTLEAVESQFAPILSQPQITYLNMGGGHWITKPDYDRQALIDMICRIRQQYNLQVWLEPGEAFAIHTGVLRCKVLDVFTTGGVNQAILDISASAHMPDTLEMPYRPDVFQITADPALASEQQPAVRLTGETYALAGMPEQHEFTYRLGAATCLAGDVIGDYSFHAPLAIGDELVFDDMAHYTMVKTTFFNGIQHPDIVIQQQDATLHTVRRFQYNDFEQRLG